MGSVDVYLDAHEPPAVSLNEGAGEPFAVIGLTEHPGRVYIAVRTAGEADALILAAVAAKDLLLGAQKPPAAATHCPDCGEVVSPVDGTCPMCRWALPPRDIVPGDLDAIPANRIGDPAPLPEGHGPNHIDNAGHVLGADPGTDHAGCVPGECVTCHGHVSAAGVFTPAAAHV